MTHWKTFAELRNQSNRQHVMFHELVAEASKRRLMWCRNRILREIAHVGRPTVKRYGHWHYGRKHLQAVIDAADREPARRLA